MNTTHDEEIADNDGENNNDETKGLKSQSPDPDRGGTTPYNMGLAHITHTSHNME